MRIGMIGLGKMGSKISEKLLLTGHQVLGYDTNKTLLKPIIDNGGVIADDFNVFVDTLNKLKIPVIWLMVPAGDITKNIIIELSSKLKPGSIVIDGGNSNYKDTMENYKILKEKDIHLLDVGTSGGIWGFERGFCFMAGGDIEPYNFISPVLKDLAAQGGYNYMGPSGSGHFVKMVHNGIEYALMEAYGEGFHLLENSKDYSLNLENIANLWQNGSIIESFLLGLTGNMFKKDPHLENIIGYVEDSGEGRWTVETSIDQRTPAPVITIALMERFRSRIKDSFKDKVIAGLRKEFGGHNVKRK